MSKEKQGILGWVDERLPVVEFWETHLSKYYAPRNFNFWYFFGSLALLILVMQILTGIFLTMHYKPDAELAFASVEYIMRDVNWGWLIRYMHSTGASAFFVVVYMHMLRGLMYGSFKEPRELIWLFGVLIYVCLMAEAFMGYLLPWGQMSYWGAQVIVNLFGTIPVIGDQLALFIRGDYVVSDATLNRFFALHVIAVPIVLLGLVVAHIAALHTVGSNNPDGVEIKKNKGADGIPLDGIPFHPYYTVKDIVGVVVFLFLFSIVVFYFPEMNGYFLEHANFEPANPLATPEHIAPVWYFTPFYTVLRAIPNPFGGVVAMGAAVMILFFLPWIDKNKVKSIRYRSVLYKVNLAVFLVAFVWLGYLGMQGVTPMRSEMALRMSELYFLFFVVLGVYSTNRSAFYYIKWFVIIIGIISAYDVYRSNAEIAALVWQTWLVPVAFLVVALLGAAFTNLDQDKTVPERVTE
ncbi:cytochrome b N-terminal domain-containing protein [Gammaproteobacteria bacterium]|jgi:ubiquinol-cytochrome c reductase cytochrome b subunit|nr:cytochrome b N-terminal domain-containing protein [Gammaproteobacteria bacterium]